MSTENLSESIIHQNCDNNEILEHIDDESQHQYLEKMAPKAQEEILIINQDCSPTDETFEADQSYGNVEVVTLKDDQLPRSHEHLEKNDEEIQLNEEHIEEHFEKNDEEIQLNEEHIEEHFEKSDEEIQLKEEHKEECFEKNDEEIQPNEEHIEEPVLLEIDNDTTKEKEEHIDEHVGEEEHIGEQEIKEVCSEQAEVKEEHMYEPEVNEEHTRNEQVHDLSEETQANEIDDKDSNVNEKLLIESDVLEETQLNTGENIQISNLKHIQSDSEISHTESTRIDNGAEKCESSKVNGDHKIPKDIKTLSSSYNNDDNINSDCEICKKTVYPLEKLSANNRIYHKQCFRCSKCRCALLAGNFSFNNDKPYCRPHYIELFKKRGRYDEEDDCVVADQRTTINDVITDELPAQDITKNLLAKFRDLESGTGTTTGVPTTSVDGSDELPAPNTTKNLMERFTALGKDCDRDQKRKPMIDIPRSSDNKACENQPICLPKDVARANEPSQDEMPEEGITKNLVNRFRDLESTGVASK